MYGVNTHVYRSPQLSRKSVQTPGFMCIDTTVIELREFNEEEEHGQNRNILFCNKFDQMWYFSIQLSFDICFAEKTT